LSIWLLLVVGLVAENKEVVAEQAGLELVLVYL
jgi:hypothetical protein